MSQTITVAGAELPVDRIKFKLLKVLLPPFIATRLSTVEGMDSAANLIAAAISAGKGEDFTPDQLGESTLNYQEILDALDVVAPLCGLKWSSAPKGEAKPASPSTGTEFTP